MPVDSRKTKLEAGYQGTPMGGLSCWTCPAFERPDACRLVRGALSGGGYCSLYPTPEASQGASLAPQTAPTKKVDLSLSPKFEKRRPQGGKGARK